MSSNNVITKKGKDLSKKYRIPTENLISSKQEKNFKEQIDTIKTLLNSSNTPFGTIKSCLSTKKFD